VRILALDTTTADGSLALLEDTQCVAQRVIHSTEGFSHLLFAHLEQLLASCEWSLSQIDAFACTSGPGSFTGVRVGLAAIKGLAHATTKPAVAVSTLRAVASFGDAPERAVVLDARRNDVYAAVYDAALIPLTPETVSPLTSWLQTIPAGKEYQFITTTPEHYRDTLTLTPFAACPLLEAPSILAPAAGRIAHAQLLQGNVPALAALDANYVRRSDAELFWKDER
jgi:tRNA threonylcarbamoyladenosine biosynthesis protein TsaB